MRLLTFTISHFSEKARWALDANGLEYVERALLPGFHIPFVRRIAPATSVPVLEHDGRVIQGSGAIMDYLERRLGKTALAPPPGTETRAAELEALADGAFGAGTQRLFYDVFLHDRSAMIDLWAQGGPRWAKPAYRLAFPLMAHGIRKLYRIDPAAIAEARDGVFRALDETDRILETRPFLLGERLSRADVALASLLAPACRPPEHVVRWGRTPERLAPLLREIEQRPTAAWVTRLYRDHRRPAAV